MSLNGLDDAKVKEAHDAAVAEPGGWFLLKYASRDEVELLGRGNGGIVEVRNTIASYEEVSPLFGFLRYRRRNVVIKYVPQECSRLVQARATVHFNAVTERFSPHDTVFPIATSKELKDSTLSAACSLHTASGSTSSSTSSLRRRRLMEIAEVAEEDNRAKRQSTVPEERPQTATGPPPPMPQSPSMDLPDSTSYTSMISEAEIGSDSSSRKIDEPRKSSQSTRPEFSNYSSYGLNGKPKVKLGPRPSLDVGGRPHTSSATSHYRPVSTLPAGLKFFSRMSKGSKDRPTSQFPTDSPSTPMSPTGIAQPMPPTLEVPRPHTSGGRPSSSSGASIKPLMSANVNTPKIPTITPQKARLMKAMELRKKQMSASAAPAEPPSQPVRVALTSPSPENDTKSGETPKDVAEEDDDDLVTLDEGKEDDSGIAFDASSAPKTDESDATRTDSYPQSPVGPSEKAESTRASSMSESTDETVQEAQTSKATPPTAIEPSNGSAVQISPNHTPKQTTQEPVSDEEHPPIEDLPLLLPVTYEPMPSPITVPAIYRIESEDPAKSSKIGQVEDHADEVLGQPDVAVEMQDASHEAEALLPHVTPLQSEKIDQAEELSEKRQVEEVLSQPDMEREAPALPLEVVEFVSQVTPFEPEHAETITEDVPKPELPDHPLSTIESEPVKTEWKVPRSKFSVQDLRAGESAHVAAHLMRESTSRTSLAGKSPVRSTFSTEARTPPVEDDQENGLLSFKSVKRKAMMEPIRTDIDADGSAADSDANISSDDDLMDELQSAVVQEAQPIMVAKSPISPVFPSPSKKAKEGNRFSRAFSSSIQREKSKPQLLSPPGKEPTRSVSASAAYLSRISQQPATPLAKKISLGSGISQRIKALEKLQRSGPAIPTPSTGSTPAASAAFFAVRKGSVRGSRSPSIAERANSLNRNSPSPPASRDSSPENFKIRERSGSIQNRLNSFNSSPVPTSRSPKSRPESISVTARIIRDPSQPFPSKSELGKDPSEYTTLDLKQSPLVIDHQKAITATQKKTIQERRLSNSSRTSKGTTNTATRERRSSITIVKDLISQGRASFSDHRRSMTMEKSESSPSVLSPALPPSAHANPSPGLHRPLSISNLRRSTSRSRDPGGAFSPPPSAAGSAQSSSSTGDEKDKKSNRANRMLRRMSSSISSSRKTIANVMSPTLREETEPLSSPARAIATSIGLTTPGIDIGDVNVQFPDTLLWKRRTMLLDPQGYLIVSPALTAHGNDRDKANAGAVRRYHLSEFRTPVIPDVEMQELPNSVVLDFVEGGGLQVACEDRAAQRHVLGILQKAHRAWAGHNP